MIEFTIPEVAPSLNRLLRMHWRTRRRLLKKWEWAIFAEVYRLGGPIAVKQVGRVAVRITRRGRKTLDQDNLHGAAKIILDALKASKVIEDDSPAHIELTCEQESGSPQTTVRIAPINALREPTGSSSLEPVSQC